VRRPGPALLLPLILAGAAHAAPAAPAFALRLLDTTRTFDSRSVLGRRVLVVRFQASWCKPCVAEAPGLERLYQRYRRRDVEVIGIQVQDTAADARKFLHAHNATYRAGLDPRLTVANRFGVTGTPFTVVIDREGRLAAQIRGESAVRRLPAILDRLLPPGRSSRP
jgi:cytochrome c biogenesis protein CcmG/thiol:disulfide interchange protein DsbE